MNKPERLTSAVAAAEFQVGGVIMRRPFRIRRLGHFGLNVADPEKSKDFYCRLLGFRISDPLDFTHRLPEDKRASVGPTLGYFARHGTDHHSFVFFPRGAYATVNAWASKPQAKRCNRPFAPLVQMRRSIPRSSPEPWRALRESEEPKFVIPCNTRCGKLWAGKSMLLRMCRLHCRLLLWMVRVSSS